MQYQETFLNFIQKQRAKNNNKKKLIKSSSKIVENKISQSTSCRKPRKCNI